MRTFIALEPSKEIRSGIAALCRALTPLFPRVSWARPESIHLTLRFLGEIDPEADLPRLKEALKEVAAVSSPPVLRVDRAGWFGSPRQPRVVWLGLRESPELTSLAAGLEDALTAAGFGAADKPFKAHLTLARLKDPLPEPLDRAALERASYAQWPLWTPREVLIIKSTLRPEGPLYETLAALPLGGAGK
ncbi:RNA 2',3'-cyclic phosphodiesterase [bacterium]|nr:RNA 2',3'-cyclic phosphodiesterase [bacterium]